MKVAKKLIEVALPLEAINEEGSRRKRKAPSGYPTTLHKWWAQRPVAAARAVIFAQMVDDPSARPDLFPTEKERDRERRRLFKIIEELVKWENTTNKEVLEQARAEIWQSWRRTCTENAGHPRAKELFDRFKLPTFLDPFAGSGALPLEAQRLGLESYASDLNPVAVLINKAMIEIPPKFVGMAPVNPKVRREKSLITRKWQGAQGLAEDVRYYGQWMRDRAEKSMAHLYPKIEITAEMVNQRPDLKPLVTQKLSVIAWLWARTVKSPNPAFATIDVPLVSTFMLSTKAGNEVYLEPLIENGGYRFTVKVGEPPDLKKAKSGTKLARANFRCLMSGSPISGDYIKAEGKAGRMGVRLLAIVANGGRRRIYSAPTAEHEMSAQKASPTWHPDGEIAARMTGGNCTPYGLTSWGDLFTPRQTVALTTFCDLVQEMHNCVKADAKAASLPDDNRALRDGGIGPNAYADAVATYLAFSLSRAVDYGSAIATWRPKDNAMRSSLPKQAIQMAWDFAEGSPLGKSSSGFSECVEVVAKVLDAALGNDTPAHVAQADAANSMIVDGSRPIISTDPPYYDNVGYADLSDFFYVWLRRSLKSVFPDLFTTVAVPKTEELVANPHRHGGKEQADAFFLDGMTQAMHRLAEQSHPGYPVTIYYAFKQSESESDEGTVSTGWETFLDAVIRAGFAITGTWPVRTEGDNRQVGIGTNALASSIVLVCRPRALDAPVATRRELVTVLKAELPAAILHLQRGNIAPVDLAQAAIGPGMAVYTRYVKVLDAEGRLLSVREALAIINQTLDEALAEQEGDFDSDTRWALAWFDQSGFSEGEFGVANVLATAKVTAVDALVRAGIVASARGKVRLLKPTELPANWNPTADQHLTAWEVVHQLIRALAVGGEVAAAVLVAKLGSKAEVARELAYRLYTISNNKKRAADALQYNGLVQSWREIVRLAAEQASATPAQTRLFET
jgi:putative DNA methylase